MNKKRSGPVTAAAAISASPRISNHVPCSDVLHLFLLDCLSRPARTRTSLPRRMPFRDATLGNSACIASPTTYTPVRRGSRTGSISFRLVQFTDIEESLDRTNGELGALRGQERYAYVANFLLPEVTASGLLRPSSLRTLGSERARSVPFHFGIVFSYSYKAAACCEPCSPDSGWE